MNIILSGDESAGARALKEIAKTNHHLVAVVASSTQSGINALIQRAQMMRIPVWPGEKVQDPSLVETIQSLKADILFNVHAKHIICEEILQAPKYGCYNLHPGPLPEYAGVNQISWAIYNGEKRFGVTVHKMIPAIDAGPIALKRYFDLDQGETGLSLMTKCVNQGVVLMLEFLDIAERSQGEVPLEAQDMSKRRYYSKKDIPIKGKSEWDQPCIQIERLIRACNYQPFVSPWAHPVIEIKKCSMGVIDAECTGIMSSDQPGSIRIDEKGDYLVCTRDHMIRLKKIVKEETA